MPTTQLRIRETVDASLARIRCHPFITDAHRGKLSREQATRWIMCAGRESRSFPLILERMIKFAKSETVLAALQRNLDDEYGHGNPQDVHFHHYLHLLDALGINRSRFDEYCEGSGINLAVNLAFNVAEAKNEGVALGYMLVNEGMTQITYSAVRAALSVFYGQLNLPFFEIHISVDERHIEELYTVVDQMPHVIDDILFGIGVGERGMAVLLDEAYGLFDYARRIPSFEPVVNIAA